MPNKNTVKVFVEDSYYHVYNRGWNLQKIFLDESDYTYFETLLLRLFAPEAVIDNKNRPYRNFNGSAQLNAYCLMGNHFHLLIYQNEAQVLSDVMKSLLTSYSMYFNKKYKQRGALFESTYKAVRIGDDAQFMHITRYIHLNHHDFRTWPRSSYRDYLDLCRSWINPQPVLDMFSSAEAYKEFVDDYESLQRERDTIKKELANG